MNDDDGARLVREFYRLYGDRLGHRPQEAEPAAPLEFDVDQLPELEAEPLPSPPADRKAEDFSDLDDLFDFDDTPTRPVIELTGSIPLTEEEAREQMDSFYKEVGQYHPDPQFYDAKTRDFFQSLVDGVYALAEQIKPSEGHLSETDELLRELRNLNYGKIPAQTAHKPAIKRNL